MFYFFNDIKKLTLVLATIGGLTYGAAMDFNMGNINQNINKISLISIDFVKKITHDIKNVLQFK